MIRAAEQIKKTLPLVDSVLDHYQPAKSLACFRQRAFLSEIMKRKSKESKPEPLVPNLWQEWELDLAPREEKLQLADELEAFISRLRASAREDESEAQKLVMERDESAVTHALGDRRDGLTSVFFLA